ncbi:DNA internalization-related competence protein ComEC/Rec2 [Gordoniibacillus kamchatkensis]|uniref:DNA internalization-related competence protein ComEC/Rec2 n=1 Tax=Gordoniibacillus kamchatkensis TaxID=1590651 RepID=UPI000698AF43|nr:DNA internalization-related competence protein ComEC/Rec2 [Paenibacillus sp. VKM B-2647]
MRRPLLWYAVAWIVGAAAAGSAWFVLPRPASLWIALGAVMAAAAIWLCKLPRANMLVVPLLAAAAFGYGEWRDGRNVTAIVDAAATDTGALSGIEATALGRIVSPVDVDGDRASFEFEAHELRLGDSGTPIALRERMRVNVRLLAQQEQAAARQFERTDRVEVSGILLRPEPGRNFGGFDYREYLRRHHIHWLLSVKGIAHVERSAAGSQLGTDRLLLWSDRLRAALAAKMDSIFPADQSGLMKSMLIGWQEDMDPEQYRQFSKLGLTHILAISGMNVAIFLGLLFAVLKRLRLTRESTLLVGIAAMPGYVLLTGASPSIVRAGIMSMMALYAARRGWLKDGLHLAALAAWAMLVWEPYYLYDVGFQLTFAITAALLAGVPRIARLLPIRKEALRQAAAITIVSQLVSFPITVYYFNVFSLLSWLANALFVPVFGTLLFPASLVSLLLGLVWMPLGRVSGALTGFLSRWTLWAIDRLAAVDGFQLIWPTPSPLWIAAYFATLALLLAALTRRFAPRDYEPPPGTAAQPSVWPVAACAAALALLLVYGYTPDRFSRTATVEFLDVGQGDAALIRTPSRKYILVDGGGTLSFRKPVDDWKERRNPFEVGRSVVVPLLQQRGVHKLDMVIATHEDQDHIGGLQAVAEQIPIGRFAFNGTLKPGATAERLFRTLLDRGVSLVPARRGSVWQADAETKLTVLAPGENSEKLRIADKQNNESVAFTLELYGRRFLFTGDMEAPEEEDILHSPAVSTTPTAPIDVMKIAHHGSKTSTTSAWLDRWRPQLAVISVGARNSYGHPSGVVLQRLWTARIPAVRTDLSGGVRFVVAPQQFRFETKLKNN